MTAGVDKTLALAMDLAGGSEEDMRQRLGFAEGDGVPVTGYGKLADLVAYQRNEAFPGRIFTKDACVVLLYLSVDLGWSPPSVAELSATFGEPEVTLTSRAGRDARHCVCAESGVAYSVDGQNLVVFADVFAPMSDGRYQSEIYEEPRPFIR